MKKNKKAKSDQNDRPLSISHIPAEQESTFSAPPPEIEGYKILDKLGESGQGQIWRAIQLSTQRQVALKVPRIGLLSYDKALARFEREVELAAGLKHPNIAHIHDSGIRQGIYYCAMDLIEGTHLDMYVKQQNLTQREILELMRTVCQAVQYAHQNGVIHRDLKPSNIMVTEDGQPYIVDFGLAKSLLEDDSTLTVSAYGEAAGTPAYMSPEQAAGRTDKVDTRTDVYSLGIILFTLLTGANPHHLSGSRFEVMRRIADEEVVRPRTFNRKIDKDLEALLLKALDRNPNRRYSSAAGLTEDIDNYLTGAPLIAGPQSRVYELKKFVRRNRVLVAGIATVLAVLVAGIVASTVFAIKANYARAEAQAVSDFLRYSVLQSLDPFWVGGRQITIRSILDAASSDLEEKFTGTPLAEADIRNTLGYAYWSLGLYKQSESHHTRGLELGRAHLGSQHPTTLEWMQNLGWAYFYQSRYDEAEELFREALEGMQRVLGEEDQRTLYSMWSLACVYLVQGRFHESNQLSIKSMQTFCRHWGEENRDAPSYVNVVALGCLIQGRYEEAERLLTKALEISRRLRGEKDWYTLTLRYRFGELCWDLGRYDEAEQHLLEVLNGRRDAWGQEHPETLWTKTSLGWLYHSQDRYEEAEDLLCTTLETARQMLSDDHLLSLHTMHGLSTLYLTQERYDEAKPLLEKALEIGRNLLGKENWYILKITNSFAKMCTAQGRYEEAEKTFWQTLECRKRIWDANHPDILETKNDLAVLYIEQGDSDRAEPLLLEAVEGRRLKLGDTHPHTLESWCNLIELYEAWGKPEKAEEWRAKLPQTKTVEQ